MMLSGAISFFGGTAFRWLFGEALDFFKAREEHKRELAMMALQFEQDKQRQEWQQAAIKANAEAGIKVIGAQAVAAGEVAADAALLSAIQGVNSASLRPGLIGAFNAFIRPELAQVAIIMLVAQALWPEHVTLTPLVLDIFCGVLGVFIGERIKAKGA